MKNVIRILVVALILCALVSVASADMKSAYTVSSVYLVDAVGWNFVEDVTLVLNDDTNYTLVYKEDIFGTTDPGIKGNKICAYFGTYTCAPAADGVAAHLDITLDTVDRIYVEQHEKAYGRQEVVNYPAVLDTANWSDDYSETVAMCSAEEFLAEYAPNAQGMTITVEDLLLDIDDIELSTKIVALPFEMPWAADAPAVPLSINR